MEDKEMKLALYKQTLNKLRETYIKKNNDYGDSVHETYVKFGALSFVVRLHDKLNRVCSLLSNKQEVLDESMEDTLLDLANYAILMTLELKMEKKKEEPTVGDDGGIL